VEQARAAYTEALSAASATTSRSSFGQPWTADGYDRVY
jgi:hypothetical protein